MIKYLNKNNDSLIDSYNYTRSSITIRLKNGLFYLFTTNKLNQEIINEMKLLAVRGCGLSAYINRYCKNAYDSKFY